MTIEKDKELEQLFNSFKPSFGSDDRFMETLSRRIETAEYLKQMQAAQVRRYKLAMLAAFIAGIVVSLFILAFVIFLPATAPIFTLGIHAAPFAFLEQNSQIITLSVISLITASSIFGLAYNIANPLTNYQQNNFRSKKAQ